MIVVLSGRDRKKNKTLFDQFFEFRYEIFFRDRGWTAPDINGPGPDQYDDDDAVYFLDLDKEERMRASMRITPTVKSSLIADRFPQLIDQGNIDRAPTIYELNRHVLRPALDGGDNSTATACLLEAVFEWCFDQRLTHLQTLIDAAALPLYLELSPLITPLGLPLPMNGGCQHTNGRTVMGVRWPICGQLLQDVCSYKRRASGRIIARQKFVKH
jgi:N-acyl-L-homoserine lactone synthetase